MEKIQIAMNDNLFIPMRRQQFRKFFQPSRILIGIFSAPTLSGFNPITLCFKMYRSYKPVIMVVAIQNINASYKLAENTSEYVLSVPGKNLARETLSCGLKSMRDVDKISELNLELCQGKKVSVPGLKAAIANIELVKETIVQTGDHLLLIGRVVQFYVNSLTNELPLLSVGPDVRGYKVLAQSGIHRIATIDHP
jgi:flavin reductase (DIM6/NTAB) family NADH-FMN oxidoreductase RutF